MAGWRRRRISETLQSPIRSRSQSAQAQPQIIANRPPSKRHIAKTSTTHWPMRDRRNGENRFIVCDEIECLGC
jgi:hypothetical protein